MAKKKKKFKQRIFTDWCKACGLCVAFCPKKVYEKDEQGRPIVKNPGACIGCRFCELHCPDFAITISELNDKDDESDDDKGGGS